MIETFIKLFSRDLEVLSVEVNEYHDEKQLWLIEKNIKNSAGTLTLHLCGNLQHFIGATLGNTGFVRHRESEFTKRVSRAELLKEIDKTKSIVLNTLENLPHYRLKDKFPMDVFGHEMTNEFFIMHLHGHLTYHLGQINYHRRLL